MYALVFAGSVLFLSTLSLRRATMGHNFGRGNIIFLSTLSLRRATALVWCSSGGASDFYPRSPCGERHTWARGSRVTYVISIHALLAESDCPKEYRWQNQQQFLSTLSLRRATGPILTIIFLTLFLSTLSLRRATHTSGYWVYVVGGFLSTLSLRRATADALGNEIRVCDFYPRSPCGERRPYCGERIVNEDISIHALLAESDNCKLCKMQSTVYISIHALLAESDWLTCERLTAL